MKYTKMATSILQDSQGEGISEIYRASKRKDLFKRERKLNYDIIKDLNKYYDIYQTELTTQDKKLL